MNRTVLLTVLALVQAVAGVRVVMRLLRTARGERIAATDAALPGERVTVVVPVLDERDRLAPCLDGLLAQPPEVAEILVVDGGSTDGTQEMVAGYARVGGRLRLVEAGPPPPERNGKAHGLQSGLDHADPASGWILTVDADVRPEPALARSLLAHAKRTGVAALSIATQQRLSGAGEGLVHPSLLTTLVYRFGIPGQVTGRVAEVQANGQCCLFRREALDGCGGFAAADGSVCEDVTVARTLAAQGHLVGFSEADGLVTTEMYAGWRDAWCNWTRSLPMRDQHSGVGGWLGLAEVTLAQALPLPLLAVARRAAPEARFALLVNAVLVMTRLGVLAGTARAYPERPWTYWLSPLADLPATVQLWRSALRRRHVWRGRVLLRDDAGDLR